MISSSATDSTKEITESTYDGIVSEAGFVGNAKMTKPESLTWSLQFTKQNKTEPRDV